ncbi:MAG: large-conductance mechanosensitive channel protein MscL [Clostridia bacterium]|nr:large-conductance mechanosensitive channel protein MscL [Clostridia bacterium]
MKDAKKKASGFIAEFKAFALQGNVLDMAVGVVIGGAFKAIVTSLVDNVITPAIGLLMGGVNFTDLSYTVNEAEIKYGAFIQSIIDFFIIALSIFVFIKVFTKLSRKRKEAEEAPAEAPKKADDVVLLEEIRDLLKEKAKDETLV